MGGGADVLQQDEGRGDHIQERHIALGLRRPGSRALGAHRNRQDHWRVGAPIAHQLRVGFVPIRKKGKLPGDTIEHHYDLEYGTDTVEIHNDAIAAGEKVLLVDDLIATGGTAEAAIHLIEKSGGQIVECCFLVDLPDVGGRGRLERQGYPVFALCEFEGD